MLPKEIQNFIEEFSRLPSIGPRQATRLAFRIIGSGLGKVSALADALEGLKRIRICSQCFFVHSSSAASAKEGSPSANLCSICSNPERDHTTFMIVEKETDVLSLERMGKYHGVYMILGELTKGGVLEEYQKSRMSVLKKIIEKLPEKKAREVILGINPNVHGDLTASLLKRELSEHAQRISRIGRGIPIGGEIEFADEDTLGHALEGRN
jgi:recombination protein RecR